MSAMLREAGLLKELAEANERIRQLEAQSVAVVGDDIPQDWKGVDGVVAWHLMDRHGEGWAHIGQMMDAWLAANSIPAAELATLREKAARLEQVEKERDEALTEQAVAVTGEPIAILRREIGEDTWFDWTPVKPGSDEHQRLRAAGEMDYCEVYQRYTQSIPASKLAALREKAESVSEGWKGWRDVYVHGYPEAAQEVLFARGGITVHGAFIGGIFWHSNEKCAAALWMPLPTPLTPDEHRAMLSAAPEGKK